MSGQGSSRIGESERGPDRGEAYGIAGLTQQLQGIDFPISRQELLDRYGRKEFQWTKGGDTYTLEECLRDVRKDKFQAITEITAAVTGSIGQRFAR